MNPGLFIKTLSVILILLFSICPSHAKERKPLSTQEQALLLSNRTSGSILGTFNGYCSLLYAVHDLIIHTDSAEINKTALSSPFPDFYKPTWKEIFDAIARQTKSSWKYDPKRDYWVFSKPQQMLPFEISMVNNWKATDEGAYIAYQPPIAPVGMDIYMMGSYSSLKNEEKELITKIRNDLALRFAQNFKKNVKIEEMLKTKVGTLDALHYMIAAPQTGIIWRQWIIVDSGMAFAIVSAIKPEHEKQILPDIEKMLKTFKIQDDKIN